MASYTKHSEERRAEREIKQAYIELCLSKGTRRNIPCKDFGFIHKHHHMGLIVLSVPNTHPPRVITAYWTVEVKEDIDRCIERFEQRLCVDKKRRDKHAAKNARPAKPVKSSRQKQPLHGNSAKHAKPAKPADSQGLFIWQKRPIISQKRPITGQKKPIHLPKESYYVAKETYLHGKRDLLRSRERSGC